MRANVLGAVAISAVAALLLTGCPQTGIVCQPGTERCGDGCADFNADRRNCGGCGNACQSGQVCVAGACQCDEPSELCGGKCVSTKTDALNCGGCGLSCAFGQLCEATVNDAGVATGQCKVSCTNPGATICGNSCIDVQSDTANCGGCGNVCVDGRSCREGSCTYDVILSCRNYGQIRGLRSSPSGVFKGPLVAMGTTPISLNAHADVLFVVDDTDRKVLQASLATFDKLNRRDGGANELAVGSIPNQIYIAEPHAYVANSGDNTLQIIGLNEDPADGGPPPPLPIHEQASHPNGFQLGTVLQVPFGANAYPEGTVVVGEHAYVPLYGAFGGGGDAGQELAKVNLNDAGVERIDLRPFATGSFDGGEVLPRPYAVASFGGKVYVTLNNLDMDYAPAAPGMLFEYDPNAAAPNGRSIDLGADRCLNTGSFAQTADVLLVGCIGKATYDSNFVVTQVEKTGVVALRRSPGPTDPLAVVGQWAPSCPTGTSCVPPSVGRIAAAGDRVFVADQGAGRVWVLENNNGVLTELTSLSAALSDACPPPGGSVFFSNVSDIIAVP